MFCIGSRIARVVDDAPQIKQPLIVSVLCCGWYLWISRLFTCFSNSIVLKIAMGHTNTFSWLMAIQQNGQLDCRRLPLWRQRGFLYQRGLHISRQLPTFRPCHSLPISGLAYHLVAVIKHLEWYCQLWWRRLAWLCCSNGGHHFHLVAVVLGLFEWLPWTSNGKVVAFVRTRTLWT